MKGYVQVYTGDGKGKTTAALGLILRAAGAGLRVSLIQFLKEGDYSEIKALRQLVPLVHVRQFGSGRFVRGRPTDEDRALADQGLEAAREDLTSGRYDVVILDEINVAGALGLVATESVLDLLRQRLRTPEHWHLKTIFTMLFSEELVWPVFMILEIFLTLLT
mgnify:CR=1 FL=1